MTNHTPTPRSNEPEDVNRRNFIKGLCATLMGFLTVGLTAPLATFLAPVAKEGEEGAFIKVPNFPAIVVGKPTKMAFESKSSDAFLNHNVVYDIWVIKNSPTEAIVYSPLCPHLNCRVGVSDEKFACPCHGSVFTPSDGKCIAGPSPRSLDTLPHKIEGGELFVKWELYKAGIPQKIEA